MMTEEERDLAIARVNERYNEGLRQEHESEVWGEYIWDWAFESWRVQFSAVPEPRGEVDWLDVECIDKVQAGIVFCDMLTSFPHVRLVCGHTIEAEYPRQEV